jgi:hypothetical protein
MAKRKIEQTTSKSSTKNNGNQIEQNDNGLGKANSNSSSTNLEDLLKHYTTKVVEHPELFVDAVAISKKNGAQTLEQTTQALLKVLYDYGSY